MKKKRTMLGVFMCVILLVAGCGTTIKDIVSEKYQMKDTVQSSIDQGDVARVYLAEGKSIDQVAKFLQGKKSPNRVSDQQDGKQVLVYDDYFVTLMEGKENPENTQLEVATYTFVRDNYQPSFFNGLFAAYILADLFDVDDWGRRQRFRCQNSVNGCYGGYVHSGGHYKGPRKTPSFRGSLSGSGLFRGGGPNAGK
ncbi:MAG TPA: DUF4247 domain-containing protein [Bacillales bacterium]|nr:DUF4247 domain-containing protein [Bacillales bacterium]